MKRHGTKKKTQLILRIHIAACHLSEGKRYRNDSHNMIYYSIRIISIVTLINYEFSRSAVISHSTSAQNDSRDSLVLRSECLIVRKTTKTKDRNSTNARNMCRNWRSVNYRYRYKLIFHSNLIELNVERKHEKACTQQQTELSSAAALLTYSCDAHFSK